MAKRKPKAKPARKTQKSRPQKPARKSAAKGKAGELAEVRQGQRTAEHVADAARDKLSAALSECDRLRHELERALGERGLRRPGDGPAQSIPGAGEGGTGRGAGS